MLIIAASLLLVFYCDLVIMQLLVLELVAAGYFVWVACGVTRLLCLVLGLVIWLLA